jgi:hypothetical protein
LGEYPCRLYACLELPSFVNIRIPATMHALSLNVQSTSDSASKDSWLQSYGLAKCVDFVVERRLCSYPYLL